MKEPDDKWSIGLEAYNPWVLYVWIRRTIYICIKMNGCLYEWNCELWGEWMEYGNSNHCRHHCLVVPFITRLAVAHFLGHGVKNAIFYLLFCFPIIDILSNQEPDMAPSVNPVQEFNKTSIFNEGLRKGSEIISTLAHQKIYVHVPAFNWF